VLINTRRLRLLPLRVADADEMAVVLGDERLHEFIGGRPASPAELRERYRRLVAGSGLAEELWLNWVVRLSGSSDQAVGTVQATVTLGKETTAAIAWVIGLPWQGNGYASEAARALVSWLSATWCPVAIIACIHREHRASQLVAERAGLAPTDREVDGEQVWELTFGLMSLAPAASELTRQP
jgi:RimJ/RimL family protein N-acetyltransferase